MSLRTYEIVEVCKDCFAVGRLRRRLFGLLKPKFEDYGPHWFPNVSAAREWIEKHEAWLAQKAIDERTFPRLVEYGYVPCDGKFHRLREGGR